MITSLLVLLTLVVIAGALGLTALTIRIIRKHTVPGTVPAGAPQGFVAKPVYPWMGRGVLAIVVCWLLLIGAISTFWFVRSNVKGLDGKIGGIADVMLMLSTNQSILAKEIEGVRTNIGGVERRLLAKVDARFNERFGALTNPGALPDGMSNPFLPAGPALPPEQLQAILDGIRGNTADIATHKSDIAALKASVADLTGRLGNVETGVQNVENSVSAVNSGLTNLASRTLSQDEIARIAGTAAGDRINTALGNYRPLMPDSVAQKVALNGRTNSLSYRRLGMFADHTATYSYNAVATVRPDKIGELGTLLDKFERTFNVTIVKSLEKAGSSRKGTTKATESFMVARFNEWVGGEWDYKRHGAAPQLDSVSITDFDFGQ